MVTLSYVKLLYEANTTAFKSSRQMFSHIRITKVMANKQRLTQLKLAKISPEM